MTKNKNQLYSEIITLTTYILGKHNADEALKNELLNALSTAFNSAVFDTTYNRNRFAPEDFIRRDASGNIIEMQCNLSKVWLPATLEYFYEDKTGRGPNGLRRLSRLAEKARKQHIAKLAKQKNLIIQNMFAGRLTQEEAEIQIAKLNALKPDFSIVVAKD